MKTEGFRYFPYAEKSFGISLYDDERVVFARKMTSLYNVFFPADAKKQLNEIMQKVESINRS